MEPIAVVSVGLANLAIIFALAMQAALWVRGIAFRQCPPQPLPMPGRQMLGQPTSFTPPPARTSAVRGMQGPEPHGAGQKKGVAIATPFNCGMTAGILLRDS